MFLPSGHYRLMVYLIAARSYFLFDLADVLWMLGLTSISLKCYGLLRYQGARTNNRGRNNTQIRPIPTIVNYRADCRQHCGSHISENLRLTQRSVNFGGLRSVNKLWQHKVYGIPTILSINVRSLPKKVEEIRQIAELNSAGAIWITESWLSTDIPDSCITIVTCPKP